MVINDFIFLLPEFFFFFCFSCLILYTGLMYYKQRYSSVLNCIFILGYGGVLYLFLLINGSYHEVIIMSFHMCIDGIVFFVKILCSFIFFSILWLIFMLFSFQKNGAPEPLLLIALFFLGACFCLMSNDFFLFYLLMEFLTIISYLLACLHKYSIFAAEASLKYFILGAMSSGFILLGFVILYGFTGLTNFIDFSILFSIGAIWTNLGLGLTISLALILCGFLFKLSVVPFHIWVPDVYEGILPPIVLLFSTLTKVVFIAIFFKILWIVFYEWCWLWEFILFFCGLLSILLGSIGGLLQTSIIRLYAYSTIVNGGFFCCFLSLGSIEGLIFLFNYLVIYIIISMALFSVLTLFLFKKYFYTHGVLFLTEISSLGNIAISATLVFCFVFFSYAGIPPLSGFLGKFFLFYSFYNQTGFLLIFLLILFTTVLTSIYYIRCIYFIFFKEDSSKMVLPFLSYWFSFILVFFLFSFFLFFFFQPTLVLYLQGLFLFL